MLKSKKIKLVFVGMCTNPSIGIGKQANFKAMSPLSIENHQERNVTISQVLNFVFDSSLGTMLNS